MEDVLRKSLRKLRVYLLKMIPMIISVLYLINTLLYPIEVCIDILSMIGGISILSWLYFYISSWADGFCIYHRMFLYYIALDETLSWYDYKIGIPVSNKGIIIIHLSIAIISLILIVYFKIRHAKLLKETTNKNIARNT